MARNDGKASLIYESVIDHIRANLLNGSLTPGSRLPTVAKLSGQLGVGPASVREAYRVLQSLGVLEVTRGRGTFVSCHVPEGRNLIQHFYFAEQQSFLNLLEARKLIEPEIAALAAARATPGEAHAILDSADEMDRLANAGLDFLDPDVRFHELIVAAAHNPVTASFLSAINHLLLDSRRLSSRIPGATPKAVHFHHLIAFSIRDRDSGRARKLMLEHILDVEQDLLHSFDARDRRDKSGSTLDQGCGRHVDPSGARG